MRITIIFLFAKLKKKRKMYIKCLSFNVNKQKFYLNTNQKLTKVILKFKNIYKYHKTPKIY